MKTPMITLAITTVIICWNHGILTNCHNLIFTHLPSSRAEGPWTSVGGMPTSVMCCTYCQQQPVCIGVNYNKGVGLCEIVTENWAGTIHNSSWSVYTVIEKLADVNIKSFATPTQSSIHQSYKKSPYNAIDGNKISNFGSGTCIYTEFSPEEWWMVDFGRVYTVTGIEVVTRTDFGGLFYNIQILISKTLIESPKLCATYPGPATSNPVRIICTEPEDGRYLKILKIDYVNGYGGLLNFCEVDFF